MAKKKFLIKYNDTDHNYMFFQPFKHLPWFMYTIVDPMLENKFVFASDVYIKKVNCPILILHAKDDGVVPYELGYRVSLKCAPLNHV